MSAPARRAFARYSLEAELLQITVPIEPHARLYERRPWVEIAWPFVQSHEEIVSLAKAAAAENDETEQAILQAQQVVKKMRGMA